MGLSSSQARLLSITARITDNEYKSQQIANQRIKLSDISNNARKEYNDALNSNTFVYVAYNNYGGYVQTSLSPAALYEYQPSKNQYALTNTAGKVLVDNKDAKNFRETDTLAEFLKRYDCLDSVSETKKYIRRTPVEKENPKYIAEVEKYKKALEDWEKNKPPETIEVEGTPAWTERTHSSPIYNEIMGTQTECMDFTFQYNYNCYMHVLTDLLGPGTYTTSKDPNTGETHEYTIYDRACQNPEHEGYHGEENGQSYGWCWQSSYHYNHYSDYVHEYINDESNQVYEHYDTTTAHHDYVDIRYDGNLYQNVDTYCAGNCDPNMSIKQRIIDLLWKVHGDYQLNNSSGGNANSLHLAEFFHFLEFDLDLATEEYHKAKSGGEIPNPDYLDYPPKPEPNFPPKTVIEYEEEPYAVVEEKLTIIDPEKAQWYTNLWYRMNGYDNPEMIERLRPEIVNDRDEDTTRTDYILSLMDIEKVTDTENFEVLDKNLMGSKDWLNNALSQGWLTMERVGKTQTSNKYELNWSSIIYTNATDITQVEDQERISLAEVKYAKTVRDIQANDKKLQADMTKLDTEHNALLTQYQSIKSAIDKNVERSFKTFQG